MSLLPAEEGFYQISSPHATTHLAQRASQSPGMDGQRLFEIIVEKKGQEIVAPEVGKLGGPRTLSITVIPDLNSSNSIQYTNMSCWVGQVGVG